MSIPLIEEFLDSIDEYMKANNIPRRQLSRQIGKPVNYITTIMKRRQHLKVEIVAAIVDALGLEIDFSVKKKAS